VWMEAKYRFVGSGRYEGNEIEGRASSLVIIVRAVAIASGENVTQNQNIRKERGWLMRPLADKRSSAVMEMERCHENFSQTWGRSAPRTNQEGTGTKSYETH